MFSAASDAPRAGPSGSRSDPLPARSPPGTASPLPGGGPPGPAFLLNSCGLRDLPFLDLKESVDGLRHDIRAVPVESLRHLVEGLEPIDAFLDRKSTRL